MELSPRSQQNPPELEEVIGEESTPRSTDQDSEENQCQTSVFPEPSLAEKKKWAVEHEDLTHLPGGEEKEKEKDSYGSSQEKMDVDNTEQCHGPVSCVEPSTAPAKERAATKKKYATEHVDVMHLPGGEKDRDGIVPDRVKDKENDQDSSQEKMEVGVEPSFPQAKKPWAAEKKKCAAEHVDVTHHSFKEPWTAKKKRCATEHVDVTHLPGAEKDRDGFSLENVEVDNCIVPDKDKDKEDDLDAFQGKMEVGVEPSFALAKNPWGAEKKKNAVQHEDVTHLLGEEKEEEEDRDVFFQENKEVDHEPSTAQAKQQQKLQLPLQQPASHRQPATTTSQPHSPFRRIDRYGNHALWFFAPEISQSKLQGRTSSNACTFIALLMGKLFSVNNNAAVNISNELSSPSVWLKILTTAIQEGNGVHDRVTGGQAINFSVDEALRYLEGFLGSIKVEEALDVGFTNEDSQVPQSSLSFHLGRLSHEASNIAAFVIVNEMTICFVARGGKLFVLDSHSHFPYGAMIGVSDMSRREAFLATVKEKLRLPHNLCSLTFVEFL